MTQGRRECSPSPGHGLSPIPGAVEGALDGVEALLRAQLGSLMTANCGPEAADRVLVDIRTCVGQLLTTANRLDLDRAAVIRHFFLYGNATYSLHELARLWRVTLEEVCAVFADRLPPAQTDEEAGTFEVDWADAVGASTVFHVFSAGEVEHALGKDFDRARSAAWKTMPILLTLPQFIVDTIARTPLLPSPGTLEARLERIICDWCEAEHLARVTLAQPASGAVRD